MCHRLIDKYNLASYPMRFEFLYLLPSNLQLPFLQVSPVVSAVNLAYLKIWNGFKADIDRVSTFGAVVILVDEFKDIFIVIGIYKDIVIASYLFW